MFLPTLKRNYLILFIGILFPSVLIAQDWYPMSRVLDQDIELFQDYSDLVFLNGSYFRLNPNCLCKRNYGQAGVARGQGAFLLSEGSYGLVGKVNLSTRYFGSSTGGRGLGRSFLRRSFSMYYLMSPSRAYSMYTLKRAYNDHVGIRSYDYYTVLRKFGSEILPLGSESIVYSQKPVISAFVYDERYYRTEFEARTFNRGYSGFSCAPDSSCIPRFNKAGVKVNWLFN